jgi:hypothetical protein
MEPNKMEMDFKKKLEQRTIQPSEMAWDRLDAMLSVTEQKKQPRRRIWMYIAASFIGLILVATLFFKQEVQKGGIPNTNSTVVDAVAPQANEVQVEDKDDNTLKAVPVIQNAVAAKTVTKKYRAGGVIVKSKSHTSAGANHQFNETDKEEVVADPELNEFMPANNETEMLLASSYAATAPVKKSSVKVNASSLLSSVEGELDESFRNKALQAVSKNFNAVKSSLANRNHN